MTIEGNVFKEKGNEGIYFYEDIDSLCKMYTKLDESDIKIIHEWANKLSDRARKTGKDWFINCSRYLENDTITVAAAYTRDSLYQYSTIGTIVKDENEPALMRTMRYGLESNDMHAVSFTSTEGNHVIQNSYPIKNHGKTIGVLTVERAMTKEDFAEWKEIAYHESDTKQYPFLRNLTRLAECTNDAVVILNDRKEVIFRNEKAQRAYHDYGYIHDIFGKNYNDISFHGPIMVGPGIQNSNHHEQLSCAGSYFEIGEYCYKEDSYFYIVIFRDATQEKEKEENLIHKSVVIREIHHRVKNNLQTVYNLLDLQRRRMPEERIQLALKEAMNRIASIASAYELLSKEGVEIVNVLDLLKKIVAKFKELVSCSDIKLDIEVKGDDTYATTDNATDIALVVNELLQNTFKHAFNERGYGRVSVTLLKRSLYSEIIVSDDGEGFDSNQEEYTGEGLGHQIAENIVEQKLKGQIMYLSDSTGTSVVFTFKSVENHTN